MPADYSVLAALFRVLQMWLCEIPPMTYEFDTLLAAVPGASDCSSHLLNIILLLSQRWRHALGFMTALHGANEGLRYESQA